MRATAVRQVVSLCMCLFADSCTERHLPKDHSIRIESNRKLNIQKNRWTDQLHGLADWKTLVLKTEDSHTKNTHQTLWTANMTLHNLTDICLRSCRCWPTRELRLSSAAARNISRVKIILKIMCPWFWVIAILMSWIKKSKDNFFGRRVKN